MFSGTVIALSFRWLNFGIFLGVLIYAYRRYLTPDLKQKLSQELHQLYQQERTLGQLNEAVHAEQAQLVDQQAQYTQLLQKLKQWQQVTAQQQALRAQAQQLQQLALQEKRQTQAANLAQLQLQQQLFKQVLVQSTQALQQQFTDPNQAERYQHAVLQRLAVGGRPN